MFTNLLDEEMLKNLELEILKEDVSSNLLFWRPLPGEEKYLCFLVVDLLPGDYRYHNLDHIGFPESDMVYINRVPTNVFTINDYNLHIIEI